MTTPVPKEYTVKGPGTLNGIAYPSILVSFASPKSIDTISEMNAMLKTKRVPIVFGDMSKNFTKHIALNDKMSSVHGWNYVNDSAIFSEDDVAAKDFTLTYFYRHDSAMNDIDELLAIRFVSDDNSKTLTEIGLTIKFMEDIKHFGILGGDVNGPYNRPLDVLTTGKFKKPTGKNAKPHIGYFWMDTKAPSAASPTFTVVEKKIVAAYNSLGKRIITASKSATLTDFDGLFRGMINGRESQSESIAKTEGESLSASKRKNVVRRKNLSDAAGKIGKNTLPVNGRKITSVVRDKSPHLGDDNMDVEKDGIVASLPQKPAIREKRTPLANNNASVNGTYEQSVSTTGNGTLNERRNTGTKRRYNPYSVSTDKKRPNAKEDTSRKKRRVTPILVPVEERARPPVTINNMPEEDVFSEGIMTLLENEITHKVVPTYIKYGEGQRDEIMKTVRDLETDSKEFKSKA